jgi:hypothetical protein
MLALEFDARHGLRERRHYRVEPAARKVPGGVSPSCRAGPGVRDAGARHHRPLARPEPAGEKVMHFLYDAAITAIAIFECYALILGARKHKDFVDFAKGAIDAFIEKERDRL